MTSAGASSVTMAGISSLLSEDILSRTSHDYCHRPIQTAAWDKLRSLASEYKIAGELGLA
jgi:hypothetical protein